MALYDKSKRSVSLSTALKYVKVSGEAASSSSGVVEPESIKFHTFTAPSLDTDITAKRLSNNDVLKQALLSTNAFSNMASIRADMPGITKPVDLRSPLVLNPFTQTFPIGAADKTIVALLENRIKNNINIHYRENVIMELNKKYLGSGTPQALITRITTQLKKGTDYTLTKEIFAYIEKYLGYGTPDHAATLTDQSVRDLDAPIVMDSHPGAPYFVSGITTSDVINDELVRAEALLTFMGEGTKQTWAYMNKQENQPIIVTMLCPKKGVYDRSEYFTKVRPFWVMPLCLRLIFGGIIYNAKKMWDLQYADHPRNPFLKMFDKRGLTTRRSAIGFTYTKGGAQDLYEWIMRERALGTMDMISWGDDQLIVITTRDGRKILLGPDVEGMDMKIKKPVFTASMYSMLNSFVPVNMRLTLPQMEKLGEQTSFLDKLQLSSAWYGAIEFMHQYYSSTPVLTVKHNCMRKNRGLNSGVPGTTEMDVIGSGFLQYAWSSISIGSLEDLPNLLKTMQTVAKSSGFPIKPIDVLQIYDGETWKYYDVSPQYTLVEREPEMNQLTIVPFLGMTLYKYLFPEDVTSDEKYKEIIVPQLSPLNLGVNAAYHGVSDSDSKVRISKIMSGLLGNGYLTLGVTDSFMLLKEAYNAYRSTGRQPLNVESVYEGVDEDEVTEYINDANEYPQPEVFAMLYVAPEVRKEYNVVKPAKAEVELQASPEVEEMDDADLPAFNAHLGSSSTTKWVPKKEEKSIHQLLKNKWTVHDEERAENVEHLTGKADIISSPSLAHPDPRIPGKGPIPIHVENMVKREEEKLLANQILNAVGSSTKPGKRGRFKAKPEEDYEVYEEEYAAQEEHDALQEKLLQDQRDMDEYEGEIHFHMESESETESEKYGFCGAFTNNPMGE